MQNRGTHAHVPTPFTSPVLFLARYTNCGSGVIEMTQAVHNFAPPESAGPDVDQNYFNVGWGGVRTGTLPIALEKGGAGNATRTAERRTGRRPAGAARACGRRGGPGPPRPSSRTWVSCKPRNVSD